MACFGYAEGLAVCARSLAVAEVPLLHEVRICMEVRRLVDRVIVGGRCAIVC
jgi:hypothetical protein